MNINDTKTPWLLSSPRHQDHIRLFCLPYAGGGASIYRGWQQAMPPYIGVYPIQLPGRENRIAERPLCSMEELVDAAAEAIAPSTEVPFILWGHSLGARIAYELTLKLRNAYDKIPLHLIVSGSRAPHLPEPRPLHQLPDEAFVQELCRFSGTPIELLQNRELMELFIPMLRADFTLDETYVFSRKAPLECPITAFGGTEDQEASREDLEAWRSYTCNSFTMQMIPGDHFFLKTQYDLLMSLVAQIIEAELGEKAIQNLCSDDACACINTFSSIHRLR